MKLTWNSLPALAATFCLTLLVGCGGEATSESSASAPEAEKPAETASAPAPDAPAPPEPGSAEDYIAQGNAKIEEAAQEFQSAQQEILQELSTVMGEAESEEEAKKAMESEESKAKMEAAQKKMEGVQTGIEKYAQDALKLYEQAKAKDANNPEVYVGMALAYNLLRDKEKAMEAIDKGTELLKAQVLASKPTPQKVMDLIQVLALQQKLDDAKSILTEIQKKYPDDEDLQELTKQVLAEIEQIKSAPPMPGMPPEAPAPKDDQK